MAKQAPVSKTHLPNLVSPTPPSAPVRQLILKQAKAGIENWVQALEAAMSLQHSALDRNDAHLAEVAGELLRAAASAQQRMQSLLSSLSGPSEATLRL